MRLPLVLLLASATLTSAGGADWAQFRGPNGSGVADPSPTVTEFGPGKNELWSRELGSGHSSPCITGDAIFLTTYDHPRKQLEVVCLAREDGNVRWRRDVPVQEVETGHPSFNPASSTPASDGERVVAYFGSFGLICFDMQGEKLWEIPMPLTKSYAGNATSPTIIGDRVILYRGNLVDHYLLAVDKRSGEQLWQVEQEEPFVHELACTACPISIGDKLIVHSARSVQAFNVATGQQIWFAKCATTATSTPVIGEGQVIVAAWNKMGEPALRPSFPTFDELVAEHDRDANRKINRREFPRLMIFHRPDGAEAPENGASVRFEQADANRDDEIDAKEWAGHLRGLEKFRSDYETHGILSIPVDSHGFVSGAQVRILEEQSIPEVPSPLYYDGIVYFVKNGGVLTCLELESGQRTARIRTKGRGTHYASPVISDGKLYCIAGDGTISVLTLGRKPELIAVNSMGENTYATPAIADGVIYVRTHSHLYAFAVED